MKRASVALSAAVVVGLATPATAATSGPHLIGDSITVQSGPIYKARHQPLATIDAANGRPVSTLTSRIKAKLAAGPAPKLWVLALGTNEGDMKFTRTQFVAAYDLIPRTSQVILVTPWRNPAVFDAARVSNMGTVEKWMKDLDNYRPNSAIASWAWTMRNVPGAAEQYVSDDGVHPTPEGAIKWAELVHQAEGRF